MVRDFWNETGHKSYFYSFPFVHHYEVPHEYCASGPEPNVHLVASLATCILTFMVYTMCRSGCAITSVFM